MNPFDPSSPAPADAEPDAPAPVDAGPDVAPPPEPARVSDLPPLPTNSVARWLREFLFSEDPTLIWALVPTGFLSMLLFTRLPGTNFIFDEQEALLANPYVRAAADPATKIRWLDAFKRDFWGLLPDRTIGSYRPVPDLVWRALWRVGVRDQTAFLHDYVNVLLHGLNGALVVLLVLRWTRDRLTAWLAGLLFVATAVSTEAVSGVVGLADILGGTGALLGLLALSLSMWAMPIGLVAATMLGLYSKESALCVVPLVPLAALLTSPITHPNRPLRWARAAVAAVATGAAFVFYVETRRRWFPVSTPPELAAQANAGKPFLHRAFVAALRWYAQPMLPHDRLNNPLIDADAPHRVAGALRVYWRGLEQVIFPWTLSGDYSAPQEPIPSRLVFPESVLGGLALVGPLVAAPVLGVAAWLRSRRAPGGAPDPWLAGFGKEAGTGAGSIDRLSLVAFALAWIVVSYVPVSNIPVLLPTVRAERFWYFPAIGTSLLLALFFAWLLRATRRRNRLWAGATAVVVFLLFQSVAARRHALDYTNDLVFWNATRKAVPDSAKAHLNYSVMLGARNDLPGRLASNAVALRLAPSWPMANVYMGDTLCRMHRAEEAMPHYLEGFKLGPNDMSLIALGLQCLWDENQLGEGSPNWDSFQEIANQSPGSWLKYLVDDMVSNGAENKGVNPKYRPRGYNEGPKKEE